MILSDGNHQSPEGGKSKVVGRGPEQSERQERRGKKNNPKRHQVRIETDMKELRRHTHTKSVYCSSATCHRHQADIE